MSRRWRSFFRRAGIAALLGIIIGLMPVPEILAALQAPVAIIAVVCYSGKILYDTLFFDHYWP